MESLVAQRLNWIESRIRLGCAAYTTTSYNMLTRTQKVKIIIEQDPINGQAETQSCALSVISMLHSKLHTHLVVDKGHKSHKAKHSIISFWIRDRRVDDQAAQLLPPVPPPASAPVGASHVREVELENKLNRMDEDVHSIHLHVGATYSYAQSIYAALEHCVDDLASNQPLISMQNDSIQVLRSWANSESRILEKLQQYDSKYFEMLAKLDQVVEGADPPVLVSSSVQTECLEYNRASHHRMKRYCFRRTDAARPSIRTQTSCIGTQTTSSACEAMTQVTARMINDFMDDASLSDDSGEASVEAESEYEADMSDGVPEPSFRPIPQAHQVSVMIDGVSGHAVAISRTEPTLFRVLLNNGSIQMLTETQMRSSMTRGREEAASSKTFA